MQKYGQDSGINHMFDSLRTLKEAINKVADTIAETLEQRSRGAMPQAKARKGVHLREKIANEILLYLLEEEKKRYFLKNFARSVSHETLALAVREKLMRVAHRNNRKQVS